MKKIQLSALLMTILVVSIVFAWIMSASTTENSGLDENASINETALNESEIKVLEYVSQKYGVQREQLEITYGNFPKSNRKIWVAKIYDNNYTPYLVSLDESGNIVNLTDIRAEERVAYAKKYGKLDVSLYEKLQTMQPGETIKVSIWLTSEDIDVMPMPKPSNSEVDEKVYEEYIAARNQTVAQQEKAVVDILEARGFKIIYVSRDVPVLFAEVSKDMITELEKRNDVAAIYLSKIYEPESEEGTEKYLQSSENTTLEMQEVEAGLQFTKGLDQPLITTLPVYVELDKKEYTANDSLNVTVYNRAKRDIAYQGGDCSIFFERESNNVWKIFKEALGNYQETVMVLESGGVCETTIPIHSLNPGIYRAAFMGGYNPMVKSYAEFVVR